MSVTDLDDDQHESLILNPAENPVIPYPVFPEFSKSLSHQSLTKSSRVIEIGKRFTEES